MSVIIVIVIVVGMLKARVYFKLCFATYTVHAGGIPVCALESSSFGEFNITDQCIVT